MMVNPASRELVTPQRLRAFFAPKSIALVGASDNSGWARFIVASCTATGFDGSLTAVHPRAGTAFGLPVVPSLRDLPEPDDLAFILAPVHAVEGVLDDLVEDEATKVICLFLEEIGDPAKFARVAEKADRAGKPIVALKVGSSPAGQQAALAHTGSVAATTRLPARRCASSTSSGSPGSRSC